MPFFFFALKSNTKNLSTHTHTHTKCLQLKGRNYFTKRNLIIFMVNGFQSKNKKRKISVRRIEEQVHHEIS